MDVSIGHIEVEKLLKCFLVGTQNVTLGNQIVDIGRIPEPCRTRLRAAVAQGQVWGAWSIGRGPMVAWAKYDVDASARLHSHVLHVDWFVPPEEFHTLWCHCDPRRPTEWTVGRGSFGETR